MLAYSSPLITETAFLAAKHRQRDKDLRGSCWDWEQEKGCAIDGLEAGAEWTANALIVLLPNAPAAIVRISCAQLVAAHG